ncbi:MAG: undecaprenyl-diphosphate phosphatase [Pleomorphochaeta sp.]
MILNFIMVEIIKSIVFGIIQGITEWLPISSTGHLLLFDKFITLNLSDDFKELFMVVIQLGSILAVLVIYFNTLNPFSLKKSKEENSKSFTIWLKVIVATLPAVVFGLLFDDLIDSVLSTWQVIAAMLFIYGVIYVIFEKKNSVMKVRVTSLDDLTYLDAFKMGCFQTLALIPGTSRSGSTILGGLVIGIERTIAAKFSFFMAIPVMFGASLLKLVKLGYSYTTLEYWVLFVGTAVSFVVSMLVIKGLINYVRNHDFSIFGWYRIVISILVTIVFLF